MEQKYGMEESTILPSSVQRRGVGPQICKFYEIWEYERRPGEYLMKFSAFVGNSMAN